MSSTFSYRITPRPSQNASWSADFTTHDVLCRKVRLSDYVAATDNYAGVVLSLPDQTTSSYIGTMSRLVPLNRDAITEITRGNVADTAVSGRRTRLSSSYRRQFASISQDLYALGVTRELYTVILRDISDYLIRNRRRGGEIDVMVWRTRAKMFQRHEDTEVDAHVEMLLQSNLSGPKPVPADSSAIDSLQVTRFSRRCVICIEDFEDGSTITRLPCDHVFHGDCIKNWLRINHDCPLCRKPVS